MPAGVRLNRMKTFFGTVPGRALLLAVVLVVLVVSGVNAFQDLRTPSQLGLPSIKYTESGVFDYAVSLKPSTLYGSAPMPEVEEVVEEEDGEEAEDEDERRHVFFRSLIDDFTLIFTYDLDADETLSEETVEVSVVVYATDPGVWEKDVADFFATQNSLPVTLDFEMDFDAYENRVEDIEEDVGITAGDVDYRIEATVNVSAQTPSGRTVEDTYVHRLDLEVDGGEVELMEPFDSAAAVVGAPVGWTHTSRFDYEVFLEPNALYDEPVLRSMGLPTAEPDEEPEAPPVGQPMQVLGPGHTYFPSLVHHIDADFRYSLQPETRVNDLSHQVGVVVTIKNQEVWQKTLSIVPTRTEDGDFTISFPVDINHYAAVIDAIGEETGVRGGSHTLDIKATVQTTGVTNLGTLNETFTHSLVGTLEKASLTFDQETLTKSEEGQVGGGTRPNPAAPPGGWRTPWLLGVGIGLAGLGFIYWREQKLRAGQQGALEAAAAAINKKYRDLVVDVRALPGQAPGETVVSLEDPADLAKIADDAIKPMLHYGSDGIHSYVVLDGGVRYQYILEPGPGDTVA